MAEITGYLALVFITLTYKGQMTEPIQVLHISFLAVALPLWTISLLRAMVEDGSFRNWAEPILICCPELLISGLVMYHEELGLDPGYHDLALVPAMLFMWFIGPWFCVAAVRKILKLRSRNALKSHS